MGESVRLIGASDVARAGSEMSGAAESMRQTFFLFDESIRIAVQQMGQFVTRLEQLDDAIKERQRLDRYRVEGRDQGVNRDELEAVVRSLVERGFTDEQIRGKVRRRFSFRGIAWRSLFTGRWRG